MLRHGKATKKVTNIGIRKLGAKYDKRIGVLTGMIFADRTKTGETT
jgi:hypothetical protein